MRRSGLFGFLILAALSPLSAAPDPPLRQHAAALEWREGGPNLPPGTRIAVLEGNLADEGWFTARIHLPAGSVLPMHWHPRHERVTILEGQAVLTMADGSGPFTFSAGDFYVNPPRLEHAVSFPAETVLQLTGVGPWALYPVTPGAAPVATGEIEILALDPAAGSQVSSSDTIRVSVRYAVNGFLPETFGLLPQFDTTTPRKTVGVTETVTRSSTQPPPERPLVPNAITSERGIRQLEISLRNLMSHEDLQRNPLRMRVLLVEAAGAGRTRPIAMSDAVEYRVAD